MSSELRDPRHDPQAGDIVSKDGVRRAVIRFTPASKTDGEAVTYRQGREALADASLASWRRWAKKADVILASSG